MSLSAETANAKIERVIVTKKQYIEALEKCIDTLTAIKKALDAHLHNFESSYTVGKLNLIACPLILGGWPLAIFGITALLLGAGTLIVTAETQEQACIEKGQLDDAKVAIAKENEAMANYVGSCAVWKDAAQGFVMGACKVWDTATKAGNEQHVPEATPEIIQLTTEMKRVQDVLGTFEVIKAIEPMASVTMNGEKGVSAIANVGMSALKSSAKLAALGFVFSGVEIVLTWTVSNATIAELQDCIAKREARLMRERKELKQLELSLC
jgi:hypothetical protein